MAKRIIPWAHVALWGANKKSEIMSMITALHGRGLGSPGIAKVMGYSERLVRYYMRELNLPQHDPGTIRDAIISHLPNDIRTKVDALRVRHQSHLAKVTKVKKNAGKVASNRVVHRKVDDVADTCSNSRREGTPAEIVRIPSLAEMLAR
jgi:hypothetical protein